MTQTIQTTIVPSNPADQKAIYSAIKEANDSLIRIAAEKDQIKAIIENMNEKFEINKGLLRKMIRVYNKQNFTTLEQENEDFSTLYETIVK